MGLGVVMERFRHMDKEPMKMGFCHDKAQLDAHLHRGLAERPAVQVQSTKYNTERSLLFNNLKDFKSHGTLVKEKTTFLE